MVNELLWLVLMLVSYVGILLAYKWFGKTGLYVWTAMSVILMNIQVLKTIQFFGFVTAMGNILYGSTFLVTDILSENHGKEAARRGVWIGFFVLVAATVIMQVSLAFIPDESDFITPALKDIFGFLPRIAISSLTAYVISQNFDVWFYQKIRKWTKEKHLWFRNNASTMVSQLLDNVIFTWMAFVGFGIFWERVFDWPIIVSIFATSYVIKWFIAILDTPFLYLAKKFSR